MKSISYDAEGDILSVTFTETKEQKQTGVELTDNIVLYFNPETEQPLALILTSYQAMMQTGAQTPLLLEGLAKIPPRLQAIILKLLQRAPLSGFLQLVEVPADNPPTSRLHEVFAPTILQTVAAN
ncbi:MAG: hypothetical protein H6645_03335 [Caldilineaceae bacterium]|nr:hypothetical protein [Caldilineaceae bacterium]